MRSYRWIPHRISSLNVKTWSKLHPLPSVVAAWSTWSHIRWVGDLPKNPTCRHYQRLSNKNTGNWWMISLNGYLILAYVSIDGDVCVISHHLITSLFTSVWPAENSKRQNLESSWEGGYSIRISFLAAARLKGFEHIADVWTPIVYFYGINRIEIWWLSLNLQL